MINTDQGVKCANCIAARPFTLNTIYCEIHNAQRATVLQRDCSFFLNRRRPLLVLEHNEAHP